MSRYKLYYADDIEELKLTLEVYKHTLETIKKDEVVEDILKMKRAFYDLNLKLSKLKGEMKIMEENHHEKITEYEHEKQNLSVRIKTVNNSLSQLKQDVNKIMDMVEQMRSTELHEKMNHVISKQDASLIEEKSEIDKLKEEILFLKEHIQPNTSTNYETTGHPSLPTIPIQDAVRQPTPPRQSEYRRLQNMIQSSGQIEQATSKKKSNMINRPNPSKSNSSKQRSHPVDFSGDVQLNVPMSKGKKSFRHADYDLNKNIITSTNKESKKKVENTNEQTPSLTADEVNPPIPTDEHPVEENQADQVEIIPEAATEQPKEPERAQSSYKKFFQYLTNETKDNNPAGNTEDPNNNNDDHQHDESNRKTEFSSLFSIFRKD
ncbi:hypothetical protein VBD025_00450 [Virgibacillus flavescens]|uniref:hypothetical protein n=1 Tax=Virgibacillus flavescens TaxID=1611422 RepID=UPI003D34EBA4